MSSEHCLGQVGLGQAGLGQAGLGQAGLGQVCVSSYCRQLATSAKENRTSPDNVEISSPLDASGQKR